MANRKIEGVLSISAATLLAWGMWRAVSRDEPVRAWTCVAMAGLVILSGLNIFVRARALAMALVAASTLFVALVVVAALIGAEHAAANRSAAIVRALLFFGLLGVASLMQAMSPRTPLGAASDGGG
jgi:hypothetical protein